MSATNTNRRPEVIPHPTDTEDAMMNPAGLIRFLWDLDLDAIQNRAKREAIHAWRERVLAVHRACLVMACPPSLDDLLWEHGHGARLETFLRRDDHEPGSFYQVNSEEMFAIVLGEPS